LSACGDRDAPGEPWGPRRGAFVFAIVPGMQRSRRSTSRKVVRLVHWNAGGARTRIAALRDAGYTVQFDAMTPEVMRAVRADPPVALLIDLSRLPSHGREIAFYFRHTKSTRHIPLVFVDGEPEKVAALRARLPDAVYTTWGRIRTALARVIARPPEVTTVPSSVLAGYSGTPLPKKLGIKVGSTVLLVGAPAGFETTLGALPEGARVSRRVRAGDVTLWFATSRAQLERDAGKLKPHAANGGLWILWPKKTSGLQSDLGEAQVRAIGLAHALVDYKICAVDDTWSGLKFSVRRAK
jgi:CheY-like chemotaxis protein